MNFFCLVTAFIILGSFGDYSFATVSKPILKWQYGGCYSSWCETGWYSSPAVADLDGDGSPEIIASGYSLVVLDGETGSVKWRTASGHDRSEPDADSVGRTWPGVVVSDVDHDNQLEIITAHNGGSVSVYNHNGYFEKGWPQRPTGMELRSLAVHDLDGNGTQEIIVSGAVSSKINTWVYESDGRIRPGWPQLNNDSGYGFGVFNDNISIGDLDHDGSVDIIVPSDVHYICAYKASGEQLATHSMYGEKKWGAVGVWESLTPELRGWGECSGERSESYRANFAQGASVIADVDGDNIDELVVTGNVYDCHQGYPPSQYTGIYIFNGDRSRFNKNGWDWRTPPVDTGEPLSEDYNIIEDYQPNPAVVDLDFDGEKEIIYPSYDGKVHCFWLDKTEHHSWPYPVYNPAEGFYRFASESVVADLDNDGCAEVMFTSWPQKTNSDPVRLGKLHVLDCKGRMIYEVALPASKSTKRKWNGALAAPTIANIDNDDDLELVINTIYAGFVAYDLPNSKKANILWQTGRNKSYSPKNGKGFDGPLTGKGINQIYLLLGD